MSGVQSQTNCHERKSSPMNQTEVSQDARILTMAGEYADLRSIQMDLAFVGDAARRIKDTDPVDDPAAMTVRSLWGSAVIAYRRCFSSGKGMGLVPHRTRLVVPRPVIDALTPDAKATHQMALHAADKHIAHRVDQDLSQMPIVLMFHRDASGQESVFGLSWMAAIHVGPSPGEAESLAALADQLRIIVEEMAATKEAGIITLASELLASDA